MMTDGWIDFRSSCCFFWCKRGGEGPSCLMCSSERLVEPSFTLYLQHVPSFWRFELTLIEVDSPLLNCDLKRLTNSLGIAYLLLHPCLRERELRWLDEPSSICTYGCLAAQAGCFSSQPWRSSWACPGTSSSQETGHSSSDPSIGPSSCFDWAFAETFANPWFSVQNYSASRSGNTFL